MEAAYAMPDEGDQAAELAFAERLNLVLQDIPSEFQQEDFNALKEILDLLEDEDAYGRGMSHGRMQVAGTPIGEAPFEDDSESFHSGEQGKVSASDSIEVRLQKTMKHIDADWEMVIDNYFHGFNYCIKSFTSVIKPKFDESLDEMHRLKLKLDKAKLYAGSRTTDLREKHLKRTQHIEMLRILDIVDELNGVLPELDGMLRRRTFREYVDRLNWAVNAIMQVAHSPTSVSFFLSVTCLISVVRRTWLGLALCMTCDCSCSNARQPSTKLFSTTCRCFH
eukprot:SAG31_NODE_99_length_25388_cov_12.710507_14_plen_279_part_00